MKIFITGATGYIGFDVAQAFRRAGYEVWGLCRTPQKAVQLEQAEIHPVIGNMEDPKTYRKTADKCAVLVHCAADYSKYADLDKQTLREMVDSACCGNQHKTVIYTTGVWLYGNTGSKPQDETDALDPLPMVQWRVATERIVVETKGIRGIVIRPGLVYGKRGGLTSEWFRGADAGTLNVVGEGKNHWTMVHIDDLSDAYVRVAESGLRGEIFNVVDRSRETVGDMVRAVARATGYKNKINFVPVEEAAKQMGPLADALALDQHVDARKASRLLGWQPRHNGFIDNVDIYYKAWKASQK